MRRNKNKKMIRAKATDAFQNMLARMGAFTPSLLESTNYPLTRLTRNFNLMNSLYRSHWLIRKIIDVIPQDMTKNWIKITSNLTPEAITELKSVERKTSIIKKITQGLRWGRLYGGALGIMLIKGQGEDLSKPLDLDSILPGDFKGILILDRWNGCYPGTSLVTDISDSEHGLPEYYYVTDPETNININIHHSRVIRFTGDELPYWEWLAEQYWGASVIDSIFDELKKRDNVSWNIANLTFLANLRVLKMSDLGQLLSTTDVNSQRELYDTVQSQNWLMNNFSMQILDKEDDFSTHQYTFSGLSDVYQQFIMDISGAAGIPVTRLFGRSPAGLNATGESDLQNYYDMIEEKQESTLRPIAEKLLPIIAMSTWGVIPDDLDFRFNPVQRATEEKLADIVAKKSTAIREARDSGIISDRIALKEYKQMSDTTGMWTNITDEDIDKASNEIDIPVETDFGLESNINGGLSNEVQQMENEKDN